MPTRVILLDGRFAVSATLAGLRADFGNFGGSRGAARGGGPARGGEPAKIWVF